MLLLLLYLQPPPRVAAVGQLAQPLRPKHLWQEQSHTKDCNKLALGAPESSVLESGVYLKREGIRNVLLGIHPVHAGAHSQVPV